MDLILLPGNDARNKEWIDNVADAVKDKYDRRIVQYYDHWESGGSFDPNVEQKKLLENVAKLKGVDGFAIFAKSAGVMLALGAIAQSAIAPKKCIFVGTAIGFGERLGFPVERWLKELSEKQIPTVFIQQENDPVISADDLKSLLQQIGFSDYQLIKVPGGDHIYSDLPMDAV